MSVFCSLTERVSILQGCFVRQAAICETHSAKWKPRVGSACKPTVQQLLIPQQFCRLNCGFMSDRPFACVFQKTDVMRDLDQREGFCTDSQHRDIRTKVYSKSARKGLREPGTRQRHFQCYRLRVLSFWPPGTYAALQDRSRLHPGPPPYSKTHAQGVVPHSRS